MPVPEIEVPIRLDAGTVFWPSSTDETSEATVRLRRVRRDGRTVLQQQWLVRCGGCACGCGRHPPPIVRREWRTV